MKIPMPTDRNSLAFLYMLCARAEGVQPVIEHGRHVGFVGPQAALDRYAARMRPLQADAWGMAPPPPPHRPKRSVRHRQAQGKP